MYYTCFHKKKLYYIIHIFSYVLYIGINYITNYFNSRKQKKEGWKNLQNDNYFYYFNKNDFNFRNCSDVKHCKSVYGEAELLMSPFEKNKIKELINNLLDNIEHKYMFIFNGISLIKVSDSIENSLPHTRGRNIILSKRWINKFLEEQNSLILEKLLSHEQFHVYQRYNPEKIDTFYSKYWNMEKLKKKLPEEILNLNRTNPDALPNINWLFKRKNDLILPLCLYKENAQSLFDTENIYFRLDKNHNFIDLKLKI